VEIAAAVSTFPQVITPGTLVDLPYGLLRRRCTGLWPVNHHGEVGAPFALGDEADGAQGAQGGSTELVDHADPAAPVAAGLAGRRCGDELISAGALGTDGCSKV
jgi:hypothetical protein